MCRPSRPPCIIGVSRLRAPPRQPSEAARTPAQWRTLAKRLTDWFKAEARAFPFRPETLDAPRDPYVVLVSEIMLQQTQAERVMERFPKFMARFPTMTSLAEASAGDVLAEWSGLGYYRRARYLHEAAKAIVARGDAPVSRDEWLALPGIGDYTSGALAAFISGELTPAVDGNVTRVIGRLMGSSDGVSRAQAATHVRAWMNAACRTSSRSATPVTMPGMLNESLIELGATLCSPRNPLCDECPLKASCVAKHEGRFVMAKNRSARSTPKPRLYCASVLVQDSQGLILLEPRAASSIWPGLWQLPTLERETHEWTAAEVGDIAPERMLREMTAFTHHLTHREVQFTAWHTLRLGVRDSKSIARRRPGAEWFTYSQAIKLPLSSPQRRLLDLWQKGW